MRQPAGLSDARRWYHASLWKQRGFSPSGPCPRCPRSAGVHEASRKRLRRTLVRAQTWAGAGSGSRAITRVLSGPRSRNPWGSWLGSQYPPVWPPGAPGAWVAAPGGGHTPGVVVSRLDARQTAVLVTRAMPGGSPGAEGQVAEGTLQAAPTLPQGLAAVAPSGAAAEEAAPSPSSWVAGPAQAGGRRGYCRPVATVQTWYRHVPCCRHDWHQGAGGVPC